MGMPTCLFVCLLTYLLFVCSFPCCLWMGGRVGWLCGCVVGWVGWLAGYCEKGVGWFIGWLFVLSCGFCVRVLVCLSFCLLVCCFILFCFALLRTLLPFLKPPRSFAGTSTPPLALPFHPIPAPPPPPPSFPLLPLFHQRHK